MEDPLICLQDMAAPLPLRRLPILIIGTGGIVRDAHLPAYRMAGFPVWGLYNRSKAKAEELAREYGIGQVFDDLSLAISSAPLETIFDLALPASMFAEALRLMPPGSHVLIQKPMGETMAQAQEILQVCRERQLQAAINCQLRYAPFVLAARALIDRGMIGDLVDMEMRLTVHTPWHLFPFLQGRPRAEIVYHSVHYIDLIRSFLGEPAGVQAMTLPHPLSPGLASVRSAILMNYGSNVRATITTNHCHDYGDRHQESYLKWEGTKGAIKARIGLLLNYPKGSGDEFEYAVKEGDKTVWTSLKISGSWFPEAFIGTMNSVQRHAVGEDASMPTSVEDVIKTMACVEAAYEASARGGISPADYLKWKI